MQKYFLICANLVLLFFLLSTGPVASRTNELPLSIPQGTRDYTTPWVDSVFASLDLEERIAQLLMIRVHTDRNEAYYDRIVREISEHNVGGVAFFRGGPQRQISMTNRIQSQAKTPLLIAMDAEWGPSMRLDSTIVFPRQMTLGAIEDDQLIYDMGMEIGRQLRRLGVHMNFAPVIDVNNNADNPVINFRAFGESREKVARKGAAYMQGLQDTGIFATAKHFPGHGDTDADSHHTLPLLRQSYEELDSIHLYPFRELINKGLHGVMIAHLEIPSLEPEAKLASTLSYNTVTRLLKNDMGFQGLVITDALDMRGVSDYFEPGELELRALMAGNDILLLPENVPAAIRTIKKAVQDGIITEELVNERCRKILYYKEKAGLDDFDYIFPNGLIDKLNSPSARLLNKRLAEAAVTLVRNEKNLIPLSGLNHRRIAALSIGEKPGNPFHAMLNEYAPVSAYGIDKNHTPDRALEMMQELEKYDLVIVSLHNNSMFVSSDYGITPESIGLIHNLSRRKDVILSLFANPYSLSFFEEEILDTEAIVVAYEEGENFEHAAAQAIFGGIQTTGKLPVTAMPFFTAGQGIVSPKPVRIRFGQPEETGIPSSLLTGIDSLAESGIRMGAYPGCQIAVIKNGVMVYNKAFGNHTYDSIQAVSPSDLYDVASVTKVAATTAAVMRLVDEGRLDLNKTLGDYLPWLRESDKNTISIRDVLSHQARLTSWIPFYLSTMEEGEFIEGIYAKDASGDFNIQVADGLFMHHSYRDTIFHEIAGSELRDNNDYIYSDLGFILLAEIVMEITGQRLDQFTEYFLYKPLGLSVTGFNPLQRFDSGRIIPSEKDTLWRRQVVKGFVHDPAAAMLGGVSGHAGLFSNAGDLAVLMQMFLQGGNYGDRQYFRKNTLEDFTRVQFPDNDNRRGLGFDKPSLDDPESGPACKSASPMSFGHSGFTGTYVWADPAENLVFVFLSNRTYPDQDNRKLIRENIRTDIHQLIYDAIQHTRTLNHFTTESTLNQ